MKNSNRKITPFHTENIEKIFILRPDNLGDLILFSGSLRHIKKFFPNAEITICIKNYAHNLLEHCPYVDKIVIWEDLISPLQRYTPASFKGKWRIESLYRWCRMFSISGFNRKNSLFILPLRNPTPEMLQIARYDRSQQKMAIIDESVLTQNQKSSELRHIFSEYLEIPHKDAHKHELTVNREFLEYMGIEVTNDDVWPEIWTVKADRDWASKNIPVDKNRLNIGVCPGVISKADKFYKPDNYVTAFSGLDPQKVNIFIFGSPSEQAQCSEVENVLKKNLTKFRILNFCGRTTIRQLAEAFKRCDLIVSNETGALHLATALKLPTVGITGGGHFGRFYPWGNPEINLTAYHMMECFNCNWNCIYDELRCIHEIDPFLVKKSIEFLVKACSDHSESFEC